jgi:hypothetical protein
VRAVVNTALRALERESRLVPLGASDTDPPASLEDPGPTPAALAERAAP